MPGGSWLKSDAVVMNCALSLNASPSTGEPDVVLAVTSTVPPTSLPKS
jgi:hypothetical protein